MFALSVEYMTPAIYERAAASKTTVLEPPRA
jgi:hypothetical protein